MATPASPDARLYFRCALQRYDDAQVLLQFDHTTGAVYLAGYGVECILKALILASVPRGSRARILASFRGATAHNFEWLRTIYSQARGSRFPREINAAFALVNDWSTDLRYLPSTLKPADAEDFLRAANRILTWAQSRF